MADARVHGDVDDVTLRALGLDPARVIDFSVNVSPLGPHPDVLAAARAAELARYPERDGRTAREAIAGALDVAPDEVALGHGAAELLFTIAHAIVAPDDVCLVVGPTFGEAFAAFAAARASVVEHRVPLETERDPDAVVRSLSLAIATHAPRVVYVCDPNNPTGRLLGASRVAALAGAHPQVRFVVDQAFLSLSTGHADARAPRPENVLLVRSMTKDHALPGLRVAYLLANRDTIARVERARPPWSTSAGAQAAVPIALTRTAHVEHARDTLLADRVALACALEAIGLAPHPSETIFLVVEVGDADAVRAALLREHLLVRSCASFDLPRHIRLCARPEADRARLCDALARLHVAPITKETAP